MNKILFSFIFIFFTGICSAQNFKGQWKGEFVDKSVSTYNWGGARCDYVLDIDVKGDRVTGYSYTYYTDGGKKFYTICTLKGTADIKKNYIEVTETERTKTNVPDNITNSFQLHKLLWRIEDGKEVLEGNWVPAPGQSKSNTGYGTTSLAKRQLTEISSLTKKPAPAKDTYSLKNSTAFSRHKVPANPKITTTGAAAKTKVNTGTAASAQTSGKSLAVKTIPVTKDTTSKVTMIAKVTAQVPKIILENFEKRNNAVLETIDVINETVKVEIYDNGDVDGDSISLFYNGDVLFAHKRLTEKAIKFELPVNNDEVNELVMYAENLGIIPPNTALMIVYDGTKRYEVRITSDLKKSGTIRFVHKTKVNHTE